MSNEIEFLCWEKDKPFEIQLEPEPLVFTVFPNQIIKFVAINCQKDFRWSLRLDEGIQLFASTLGDYEIQIFEDDLLIEDWYSFIADQDLKITAYNTGSCKNGG